jgi:hypothetical protein
LDGGYITWIDIYANVNTYVENFFPLLQFPVPLINAPRFFKAPFYDADVVEYAEENKQPFSLMEVITLSQTELRAPEYTGPVLVLALSPRAKFPHPSLQS